MTGQRSAATWALWLAIAAVGIGGTATAVEVVIGIDERTAHYDGRLDVEGILDTFHPARRRGESRPLGRSEAFLDDARGTAEVHDAEGGLIATWAIVELLPWLLAAAALRAIAPVLRGADRGDPFGGDVARRLGGAGSLLLVGIPGIVVLRYLLAEWGSGGAAIAPAVEPAMTISVLHFLPGLLLLALAAVFQQGAELRELERHTV
ncbi:MAG TPA: hypothetical protein VF529_05100 [Solirubrobacteraceae bacterium]|jgi:hypothetical protein